MCARFRVDFTGTEGTRRRNAHQPLRLCPGGCIRDSPAGGDGDSFFWGMESQFNSYLLASLRPPLLFWCCGRDWMQTLGRFLFSLPPGLREKCRRTGGWRRDRAGLGSRGRGDAPREREALGSASRAARAASGVAGVLETERGSPGRKDARCAGTRPASSASIRSPGRCSPGTILVAPGRLTLAPWQSFPKPP